MGEIEIKDKENSFDKELISELEIKVLLVENHPLAAKIAQNILSHFGCQVDIAVDGKKALKVLDNQHYDLIVLAIGLPDMDGYEVAKRIRSHELTSISHIPIIALTAYTDSDNQQHCLDAKINAVITKPLTLEKTKNILGAFISSRKKNKNTLNNNEDFNSQEKIVDLEYARSLLGNNEAVVNDTLNMLIDSLPREAEKITEAYQQKNWEELSAIAHKLKGGSSYCGTLQLKATCSELDNYLKSGLTARIPELYQKMLADIQALQNFRKNLS